jgi:hypothetical protein
MLPIIERKIKLVFLRLSPATELGGSVGDDTNYAHALFD